MIREIDLKYIEEKQYTTDNAENYILGFKKVNILIGGNNSGKSRFMRSLLLSLPEIIKQNRNVVISLKNSGPELIGLLDTLYKNTNEPLFNYHTTNLEAVIYEGHQIAPIIFLTKLLPGNMHPSKQKEFPKEHWFSHNLTKVLNLVGKIFTNTFQENSSNEFVNYYYIPVLRGLKPLHLEDNKYIYDHIYVNRIINDYPGLNKVFTGLEIFEEIKKRLLGEEKDRLIIKEFEKFLSNNLFGEHVTLIPKYGDDILNIKIGEDPQRSIVNLGDGLQAIICILFPIFMEKDKEYYFFIEEPELNLHPLLQKKLISLLSAPIFNQHQYFITTHSAHIIDHENASIYNFTKKDDKTIITHLDNQGKLVSALNTMGYTPSDLLQTNFIIWVEGPSDKIYINHLISKIDHSLKENLHYTIMFYAGTTSKYLFGEDISKSMIFSLNRNCAYICDSDRLSKNCKTNKHLHTATLVEKLSDIGIYTWMSPYREFENHIDSSLFLSAVKEIYRKPSAVFIEDNNYSDRFLIQIDEEITSPKKEIKLTNTLFDLIKSRKYKNRIDKIPIDILIAELQLSIDESINKTTLKVEKKVAIAEYIVNNDFEPDSYLATMMNELIDRIKKVNNLE